MKIIDTKERQREEKRREGEHCMQKEDTNVERSRQSEGTSKLEKSRNQQQREEEEADDDEDGGPTVMRRLNKQRNG